MGITPEYFQFYDIGSVVEYRLPRQELLMPDTVYYYDVYVYDEVTKHTRDVFDFLDLLGDLGGVMEIIVIAFGYIMSSMSEFSFNLKAIEKLFLVRTKDETLL